MSNDTPKPWWAQGLEAERALRDCVGTIIGDNPRALIEWEGIFLMMTWPSLPWIEDADEWYAVELARTKDNAPA